MTTRSHIRAFSVAEFSTIHQALREIRSLQSKSNLSKEEEELMLRQRIQEIIGVSEPPTACSQ